MSAASIDELKQLLIENCVLKVKPEVITANTPLFGPGSIGLDSLDALQMTVAIEQRFGYAIPDPKVAREVLVSLATLAAWIDAQRAKVA